jgi:hypothetical protein
MAVREWSSPSLRVTGKPVEKRLMPVMLQPLVKRRRILEKARLNGISQV